MLRNLEGYQRAEKSPNDPMFSLSLGSHQPEEAPIWWTPIWTQMRSQVSNWRARGYLLLVAPRKGMTLSREEDLAIAEKSRKWVEDLPRAACRYWSLLSATTSSRCNRQWLLLQQYLIKVRKTTTNSTPRRAITRANLISIWERTATTFQYLRISKASTFPWKRCKKKWTRNLATTR